MESVSFNGVAVNPMRGSGRIVKCMVKELLFGLMVENMLVNTPRMSKRVMVFSLGLMGRYFDFLIL